MNDNQMVTQDIDWSFIVKTIGREKCVLFLGSRY